MKMQLHDNSTHVRTTYKHTDTHTYTHKQKKQKREKVSSCLQVASARSWLDEATVKYKSRACNVAVKCKLSEATVR